MIGMLLLICIKNLPLCAAAHLVHVLEPTLDIDKQGSHLPNLAKLYFDPFILAFLYKQSARPILLFVKRWLIVCLLNLHFGGFFFRCQDNV